MGPGASGDVVKAYQQRFVDLHFDPGAVDGKYGGAMTYAVQALQKIIGVPRTGRIGAAEARRARGLPVPAAAAAERRSEPHRDRHHQAGDHALRELPGAPHHHDVDRIGRALLLQHAAREPDPPHLRGREHAVRAVHLHPLRERLGQVAARSAVQPLLLQRRHRGARLRSPCRPSPASHGCARIPMHIAEYFHTLVHVGDPVYVFGGTPGARPLEHPDRAGPARTTADHSTGRRRRHRATGDDPGHRAAADRRPPDHRPDDHPDRVIPARSRGSQPIQRAEQS